VTGLTVIQQQEKEERRKNAIKKNQLYTTKYRHMANNSGTTYPNSD